MAGIGSMELLVFLVVALLAIGPDRLPSAARTLGRALGTMKRAMNEAASTLAEADDELKAAAHEVNAGMQDAQKMVRESLTPTTPQAERRGMTPAPNADCTAAPSGSSAAQDREEARDMPNTQGIQDKQDLFMTQDLPDAQQAKDAATERETK